MYQYAAPPSWPATMSLRFRLFGGHQHADEREAHRDFVADDLRGGAQATEERVLRVRCPAGEDDAVHAHRRHREDVEQAGVDVRQHPRVGERNHRPRRERGSKRQHRRDKEQRAARTGRDDDLLEQHLQHVGERLQQSERADAIGPDAHLHPADYLPLGVGQVRDGQDQRNGDHDDLDERPHGQPPRAHRVLNRLQQVGHRSGSLDGHGTGQPFEPARGRMRGRDAHDTRRHRRIDLRCKHRLAATLADLHLRAFGQPELIEQRLMQPRLRRLRIGCRLQRGGPAHQRIGEMDRYVGNAFDAARGLRPASPSRRSSRSTACARARPTAPSTASRICSSCRTRIPAVRASCRARATPSSRGAPARPAERHRENVARGPRS